MSEILTVGYNDHALLGDGWHERSVDERNGVIYRPSTASAVFSLTVDTSHTTMCLLLSAHASLAGKPIVLRLFHGDRMIGEYEFDNDDWRLVEVPFSADEAGTVQFTLKIAPTIIPHVCTGNGDFREIGINLAAARLRN